MSSEEIPVIDLSCSEADQEKVAERLVDAFCTVGFATLVHHGVSQHVMARAFDSSKQFFNLPEEIKIKYKYKGHASNRGYIRVGAEAHETQPDRKETYDIGLEGEQGFETPWPRELEEFRFKENMLEYWQEFNKLNLKIMRLIGIGLKMQDRDYFVDRCNEEHCNLRLLHYPALQRDKVNVSPGEPVLRGARHTDFGSITLLAQDEVGGLRVQCRDGTWKFVPPLAGGIVVNVGDMLQRWTNDVLRATPHQVVDWPGKHFDLIPERFSIAFFCNANKGVLLETVDGLSVEDVKYQPVNAFQYLTQKLSSSIF